MDYRSMIETAVKNGGGEKAMWKSVEATNAAMEYIREKDPAKYHSLLRDLHEDLCGAHYDKEFAEADVEKICYTDAAGNEHHGAHWTMEQIETATQGKKFPDGTTPWDRYVAYNAAYADFCKKFDDEQVLDIAYLFFFADEDWNGKGKIWKYMQINQ